VKSPSRHSADNSRCAAVQSLPIKNSFSHATNRIRATAICLAPLDVYTDLESACHSTNNRTPPRQAIQSSRVWYGAS
jgi:hypothetical protein